MAMRRVVEKTKIRVVFFFAIAFSLALLYRLQVYNSTPSSAVGSYGRYSSYKRVSTSSYKDQFDGYLERYCDASKLEYNLICIKKMKELHLRMQGELERSTQEGKYDKCKDDCVGRHGSNPFLYHSFWDIKNGTAKPVQVRMLRLQLYSFLATQNPCCSKLIVWKMPLKFDPSVIKSLGEEFKHHIDVTRRLEIRNFVLKDLCTTNSPTTSSFARHSICKDTKKAVASFAKSPMTPFSDFVRFFILDLFGGIYTDGDVMFLRDMRLLWSRNFFYRWSYISHGNTAVMGMDKIEDPSVLELINDLIDSTTGKGAEQLVAQTHPFAISDRIRSLVKRKDPKFSGNGAIGYKPFQMMHLSHFDPAWLCSDKKEKRPPKGTGICVFSEFAQDLSSSPTQRDEKQHLRDFFPGVFTLHIHLNAAISPFKGIIADSSYFRQFERHFASASLD
eukprot:Nk52_evm9s168 gene=Nk52_evmTU9s168